MKLVWDEGAWQDYLHWQLQHHKIVKRINVLLKEIQRNGNDGIERRDRRDRRDR